ncbi:hypothetical protein [Granulicella arctica]|uniref:Uncharacterized protein n=1 Tax=Granulicella arctica TaxID=940613 RepID=A0A7Y9TLW5_9BACT|nr:hypothetical protein [Granulicella arctica]NYF80547.1 hypothetical protein [Granulicella arctica]
MIKRRSLLLLMLALPMLGFAQRAADWRGATEAELHALIPARAPVVTERIETEFRTASGVTDGRGRFIAGVVLITAGYSAEGKYSNFFIAQVPVRVGTMLLPTGQYVFGWTRSEDSLTVKFYEAATGKPVGTVEARHDETIKRVESFRIWPPKDKSVIQLGRFTFPYALGS